MPVDAGEHPLHSPQCKRPATGRGVAQRKASGVRIGFARCPEQGSRSYFMDRIQKTRERASVSEMAAVLGGMATPVTLFFQWLE